MFTKKRITTMLILFVVLVAGSVLTLVIVHAAQRVNTTPQLAVKGVVTRKLIFSDEFNAKSLDTSKWNTCYDTYSTEFSGCTNHGNFESEWYTKSQVSVENGNLVLTAQKKQTRGSTDQGKEHYYDYTSGMVSSGRYIKQAPAKFATSYGYYEAKINTPEGKALWPAFWLLPIDHDWPPEIDVMEMLGDKPDQALTTYFWKGLPNQGVPKDSSNYTAPTKLTNSWHTYAVNWQPGVLDWYIDGLNVKHVESSNVPSKDMQIIFDLAVGGTLPGYPDSTTPDTSQMLVDYVRVYDNK